MIRIENFLVSLEVRKGLRISLFIYFALRDMSTTCDTASSKLPFVIAIFGFGNFGQFLGRAFKNLRGSEVRLVAASRTDYSSLGICDQFYPSASALLEGETNLDVLLFCVSIKSLESVISGFPFGLLGPRTPLVVEVCSVKQLPKAILHKYVPANLSIFLTHPMFGPNTAGVDKDSSWQGKRMIYDFSLLNPSRYQTTPATETKQGESQVKTPAQIQAKEFLNLFSARQATMVELNCEEHDALAAKTQFLTHFLSQSLKPMLIDTQVDTTSYNRLKDTLGLVRGCSTDLYHGLYLYNVGSCESMLDELQNTISQARQQLKTLTQDNQAASDTPTENKSS